MLKNAPTYTLFINKVLNILLYTYVYIHIIYLRIVYIITVEHRQLKLQQLGNFRNSKKKNLFPHTLWTLLNSLKCLRYINLENSTFSDPLVLGYWSFSTLLFYFPINFINVIWNFKKYTFYQGSAWFYHYK